VPEFQLLTFEEAERLLVAGWEAPRLDTPPPALCCFRVKQGQSADVAVPPRDGW